ncbi:hypothetical protein E2C01_089816 [Portunus trituberculatus]|uniref:Uncharacterized protein n=1 Tax=Portunus trituberculatus TaxID=210409 RepID=A0A5B7JNG7_PORTR|nr:hypothetical protein [Portunus trituberculatus]
MVKDGGNGDDDVEEEEKEEDYKGLYKQKEQQIPRSLPRLLSITTVHLITNIRRKNIIKEEEEEEEEEEDLAAFRRSLCHVALRAAWYVNFIIKPSDGGDRVGGSGWAGERVCVGA